MTDPRASSAVQHLPVDDPPPARWSWAVVTPDPAGRVRLPAAGIEVLGPDPVHGRVVRGVLVLGPCDGPGRPVGIDRRGRCYLPPRLRRRAVLVATDPVDAVVLLTDAAVLEPIGEQLQRAARR